MTMNISMWAGPPAYVDGFDISVEHLLDDGSVVTLVHRGCGATVGALDDNTEMNKLVTVCAHHVCPPVHRPNNVRCEAVMSAWENLRDSFDADHIPVADVIRVAKGYIADGTSTCTCEP